MSTRPINLTTYSIEIFVFLLLQMAFLQSRSVSLVDMYIDNTEPSENVGQIQFSLEYDFQNSTLMLRIIQVSYYRDCKFHARLCLSVTEWPSTFNLSRASNRIPRLLPIHLHCGIFSVNPSSVTPPYGRVGILCLDCSYSI